MKWILSFLFFLGCAGNVSSHTIEQLKNEILTLAQSCGEEIEEDFENKIAEQSRVLGGRQLQRSLETMKENIRCE